MRRRRNVTVVLVAGLAITLAWLLPTFRDGGQPAYQGRPLRYWLARTQGGETNEQDLHLALNHIGTNALPFLVKWIRYERPEWRDWLYQKAPESLEDLTIAGAERRADASEVALDYLGTNAAPALLALTTMARDTNAPETAARAIHALACIGPAGIDALVPIAQDTNNPAWFGAIANIGKTPVDNPFQAYRVATLARLTDETNRPDVRMGAVHFLGEQVAVPALALPTMMHCMTNEPANLNLRIVAIMAVRRFGSLGTNCVPVLQDASNDPDALVRMAATNAINSILYPRSIDTPPLAPMFDENSRDL